MKDRGRMAEMTPLKTPKTSQRIAAPTTRVSVMGSAAP